MNDISNVPAAQSARSSERLPAHPLGWLRGEIDRLFDDFNVGRPVRSIFNFPAGFDTLNPAADLVEEKGAYRLSVELPGLKQDDIDVEYRDGVLTISGEKKEESESKENGCILSERRYGSFRRQLSLPTDVDPEGINADFKDGVLTLEMKKDENAAIKPRKIKIG
jgi:HSP20 family protein